MNFERFVDLKHVLSTVQEHLQGWIGVSELLLSLLNLAHKLTIALVSLKQVELLYSNIQNLDLPQ
jgi:hypothetical protein